MIPSLFRSLRYLAPFLALLASGCGGGGSSSSVAMSTAPPTATPDPMPSPTPTSVAYTGHEIIEAGGQIALGLLPTGAGAPAGVTVGPPIAGLVVTYPDGSQQIADLSGTFTPAQSSYGQANATSLETNPGAAPFVTLADPSGAAQPIGAQLSAASATSSAVSSSAAFAQNAYAHILDSPQINLAHVEIHPSAINATAGAIIPLEVVGVDNSGHVTSLAGTSINWAQPSLGGSIFPIPGTNQALFAAPASGTGTTGSGAAVTVTSGATTQSYSAAYNISFVDATGGATVNGTVQPAPNAQAIPSGSFVQFVQRSGLPPGAHPFSWYAKINSSGSFSLVLPKTVNFIPVIGLNTSKGMLFEGLTAPNGTPIYTSGIAGSVTSATFALSANPTIYIDNSTGYQPLPPISSYIHDAWFSSFIPLTRHIFDADSGLQPILATPSTSASGTVGTGLFKYWKYQWSSVGGAQVLTIVEAYGNGSAGRRTAAITLGPNGSYTYVRYYAPSGTVSTNAPLVANQPGVLLDSDGSWTQTSPPSATAASSNFSASVKINDYNSSHQVAGAPVYSESLSYSRSAGGAVTLANDNYTDSKGNLLWTFNGSRSGYNAAAYGTPQAVYSYTGALTRVYHTTKGDTQTPFTLSGTIDGDGSGLVSYTNATTGTQVSYALLATSATASTRATGQVVTASATPSLQATFTISTGNQVTATISADPADNFPGTQITFGL